jgi:TolB-like protein
VRRLVHDKRGSVYAFKSELDAWRESRKPVEVPGAEPADAARDETAIGHAPASPQIPATQLTRRWGLVAAAVVALCAVGFAWYRSRPARPVIRTIAVLPFDNLSHEPSPEWFSDGMTATLISELSKIRSVNVISLTSVKQYKSAPKSTKAIAADLGVDAVVEGPALRVGDRVRITAQLIAAATDTHLRGNDFDAAMKDVLSLQQRRAREIAREVGARLTPEDRRAGQRRRLSSRSEGDGHVSEWAVSL